MKENSKLYWFVFGKRRHYGLISNTVLVSLTYEYSFFMVTLWHRRYMTKHQFLKTKSISKSLKKDLVEFSPLIERTWLEKKIANL